MQNFILNNPRRLFFQWLILGMALLVLGGGLIYFLARQHNEIETKETERLANLAKVLDANLAHQLEATDRVLVGIREDMASLKTKKDGKSIANARLRAMKDAMPGVRTISVYNTAGTIVASSRAELIGRDFSQREYFQHSRNHPDPALLYLTEPYKTVLGVYSINLLRVMTGPRGEFAGIVGATLDPEYFITLLQSVVFAPDVRASLNHSDGKMFLIVPGPKDVEGMDLAVPGSFYTRHLESKQDANIFTGFAYSTRSERMIAMRTLKSDKRTTDKTLMISVARDLPFLFAGWRRDAFAQGILFAALTLAAVIGLYIYQRRERNFARIEINYLKALKDNEEKYRFVADFAYTWESWIAPNGIYTYVSPACERITGYRAEEFLQDPKLLLKIVHPDDRQSIATHIHDVLQGNSNPLNLEFRIITRAGQERWINHICNDIYSSTGDFLGRRSSNNDITDRKHFLKERDKLSAILENSPDFIGFADRRTMKIQYINKAGRSMCGIGEEEDVTALMVADVHPEWANRLFEQEIIPAALKVGIWRGECAFVDRAGREIPVSMVLMSHRSGTGEVEFFSTISRDITERQEAEAALKESEERFRLAIGATNDGIWEWNLKTNQGFFSPRWCEIIGYSLDDPEFPHTFDQWAARIHPDDYEQMIKVRNKHMEKGTEYDINFRYRHISGEYRWQNIRGKVIEDKDGKPTKIVGRLSDITKRKTADEQIIRSLYEKEVLLREIHHRVKNNMQVICSLLNLQATGVNDSNARAELAKNRDRIYSMALIHEKLYGSEDLANIDFREYLQSLLPDIAETYQRPDILLDVGGTSVMIDVNVGVPCGLIVNELVSNCFKYAFPGKRNGVIRVGINRYDEEKCILTVADNGIGFPAGVDFRDTPTLGMQLVTGLVNQIDGTIELLNGEGATYNIIFTQAERLKEQYV